MIFIKKRGIYWSYFLGLCVSHASAFLFWKRREKQWKEMIISLLFGTRRLFVLKAPQSTAEKKDNFTFVLHIFGDSTGEIVFIYRRVFYWSYFLAPLTKKKSYFRRQSFVSRTRRLFVLKAPRKTVKRNDNFTSFWHSLVIWPVK